MVIDCPSTKVSISDITLSGVVSIGSLNLTGCSLTVIAGSTLNVAGPFVMGSYLIVRDGGHVRASTISLLPSSYSCVARYSIECITLTNVDLLNCTQQR